MVGYVNDVYTSVFKHELEDELEDHNTVIMAMEAVDNPQQLHFKALKKLTLEAFSNEVDLKKIKNAQKAKKKEKKLRRSSDVLLYRKEDREEEDDQSSNQVSASSNKQSFGREDPPKSTGSNTRGSAENNVLGKRLLDGEVYLENLEEVMDIAAQGHSVNLIFRNSKDMRRSKESLTHEELMDEQLRKLSEERQRIQEELKRISKGDAEVEKKKKLLMEIEDTASVVASKKKEHTDKRKGMSRARKVIFWWKYLSVKKKRAYFRRLEVAAMFFILLSPMFVSFKNLLFIRNQSQDFEVLQSSLSSKNIEKSSKMTEN